VNELYKPFEPDWTVSPGEMLQELLEERGLNPFGLAGPEDPLLAVFGENLEAVRGILAAALPVTAEIAAELERALCPAPQARYWLSAEKTYQADLVRLGRDCRICARCRRHLVDADDAGWYFQTPVTDPRMPGFTFMDRVHQCDDKPHDVIVRDRDLMAELEKAQRCPYC
jgi:plasmid maintenance system antidote protein VapI